MLTIEPVQEFQLGELRQIAIQSYAETFAVHNTEENLELFFKESYSQEQFVREFHEPDTLCCMARYNGKGIGYLRLRQSREAESMLGKSTVELQRLYVLAEYKGKGAGSLLMSKAIEYAKNKRAEWIWLGVWERNFAAQKFYFSNGFVKFGEHVFQMGDDPQIDWMLKKRLEYSIYS
jgi:diamine N-acetyltransferase